MIMNRAPVAAAKAEGPIPYEISEPLTVCPCCGRTAADLLNRGTCLGNVCCIQCWDRHVRTHVSRMSVATIEWHRSASYFYGAVLRAEGKLPALLQVEDPDPAIYAVAHWGVSELAQWLFAADVRITTKVWEITGPNIAGVEGRSNTFSTNLAMAWLYGGPLMETDPRYALERTVRAEAEARAAFVWNRIQEHEAKGRPPQEG